MEGNLQAQVENAIENGKKFYAPDSRENSALESAGRFDRGHTRQYFLRNSIGEQLKPIRTGIRIFSLHRFGADDDDD